MDFNYQNRITPENIESLKPNEYFVFGSNLAGKHGAGAALVAKQKFKAQYGVGCGYQGQCFAIPTKDKNLNILPLCKIKDYVTDFISKAKGSDSIKYRVVYLVTKIGCGLAGYTPEQIAPMFQSAIYCENIHLPIEFWEVLIKQNNLKDNLNQAENNLSNNMETTKNKFSVNDVVQVQSTVSDLEYVGLLGYVKSISGSVVTVSFYHAQVKGENAYVTDCEFLDSELYLVGKCNPELTPN